MLAVVFSLSLSLLTGCGPEAKKEGFGKYKEQEKPAAHEHAEHGPHGGHIIEIGNDHQYHGEVTFDAKAKTIAVYLFGADLKTPLAIPEKEVTLNLMIDKKPQSFELKATPQKEDPEGKSSKFELAGDLIVAEKIHDDEDLQGQLNVSIDGNPYVGKIVHDHDHDHGHDHDHDHDHKDEKKTDAKPPAEPAKEPAPTEEKK
jgi:hypothetical protein